MEGHEQGRHLPSHRPGVRGLTEPGLGLPTLPDGVCGHEHLVQLVSLHEAADLLHGPFQAGHILPVAPDEVLPSQVDAKVGAA